MKGTIVQVIRQSMDKCTTEQFWAVATTIGINSYIISNIDKYRLNPTFLWAVFVFSTSLSAYVIFFILHRAWQHMKLAEMLYQLIDSSDDIEEDIKLFFKCPGTFKLSDFSGAGLYVFLVVCIYTALVITKFSL